MTRKDGWIALYHNIHNTAHVVRDVLQDSVIWFAPALVSVLMFISVLTYLLPY